VEVPLNARPPVPPVPEMLNVVACAVIPSPRVLEYRST
jgi:hypothetical protein